MWLCLKCRKWFCVPARMTTETVEQASKQNPWEKETRRRKLTEKYVCPYCESLEISEMKI